MLGVLDDTISNFSKKHKKDLLKVIKLARDFVATGTCVGEESVLVDETREQEEEAEQRPKKRSKTVKKK